MAQANDRMKYGVCINRDFEDKTCPKCESKEVQKIRLGQDFVCEECKENLRQVPPPKETNFVTIGITVAIVILIGGLASYFMFFNKNDNESSLVTETEITNTENTETNTTQIDTSKVLMKVEPVSESGTKPASTSNTEGKSTSLGISEGNNKGGNSKISVKGGSYVGEVKNGTPHGQGTLTYNTRTRISNRDMKERYAEAGHYISGEFYEGELVQGKLYDKNNEPMESIILGRPR